MFPIETAGYQLNIRVYRSYLKKVISGTCQVALPVWRCYPKPTRTVSTRGSQGLLNCFLAGFLTQKWGKWENQLHWHGNKGKLGKTSLQKEHFSWSFTWSLSFLGGNQEHWNLRGSNVLTVIDFGLCDFPLIFYQTNTRASIWYSIHALCSLFVNIRGFFWAQLPRNQVIK